MLHLLSPSLSEDGFHSNKYRGILSLTVFEKTWLLDKCQMLLPGTLILLETATNQQRYVNDVYKNSLQSTFLPDIDRMSISKKIVFLKRIFFPF